MDLNSSKYKGIGIICGAILIIIVVIIVVGLIKRNNINLSKEKEGGKEYSQSELNNYDFKITGIDEELKEKIPNYNDFLLSLKEYTYKKGIIQGNNAQYIKYDENTKTKLISIEFQLNDKNKTKIVALIDLNTKTYNFKSNRN